MPGTECGAAGGGCKAATDEVSRTTISTRGRHNGRSRARCKARGTPPPRGRRSFDLTLGAG
eukprot:8301754-Alexandrium_andersonii.AAC.1